MENIQQFLAEIRRLTEIGNVRRAEKLSRGEEFNLFAELGMEADEVHLHSAFIAMLLNPKASHGQGGLFLKPLIEVIREKDNKDQTSFFLTGSAYDVEVEKSIGALEGEDGGRIDIMVSTDKGEGLIIENKIYAGDQFGQMKRYWNYANKVYHGDRSKFRLVYLTLDGHSPSDDSVKGLNPEDYICLSYQHDIVDWLERCLALVVRQPLLRETINQYISTIKRLTYSGMDTVNEIIDVMSKEEYLDAVFAINGNINSMIDNIINNQLYPQLRALAESRNLELGFNAGPGWMTESWVGWSFSSDRMKHFIIKMEFEKRGLGDLIIGFLKKKGQSREDIYDWDKLWSRTTSIGKNNQAWIWRSFPTFNWWNNPKALKAIMDGHTMIDIISSEIDSLIAATEGLDV